jgi:hypothetical protein
MTDAGTWPSRARCGAKLQMDQRSEEGPYAGAIRVRLAIPGWGPLDLRL